MPNLEPKQRLENSPVVSPVYAGKTSGNMNIIFLFIFIATGHVERRGLIITSYYIRQGDHQQGPISPEELRTGILQFEIELTAEISDQKNEGYVPLEQVWREACQGIWRVNEEEEEEGLSIKPTEIQKPIWLNDFIAETNEASSREKPSGRINNSTHYRGFWIRFLAQVIDKFVLTISTFPLLYLIYKGFIPTVIPTGVNHLEKIEAVEFTYNVYLLIITWIYISGLHSSVWQATLGKKLLGFIVVDDEGNRISFAKATARFILLSLSIFILGPLLAAFTKRKQGLHDLILGTYVITPNSTNPNHQP